MKTEITRLLSIFSKGVYSEKYWNNLFDNFENTTIGYVIKDNEKIVGFIGTINRDRIISNQNYKIYNLSSLIVSWQYRVYTMRLLREIGRLENVILTSLTPTHTSYQLAKYFGFKILDDSFFLFFPIPMITNSIKHSFEKKFIFSFLQDTEHKKILSDHARFNCRHFLVYNKYEFCYLIFSKIIKWNIPFVHIHFLSNSQFFERNIYKITWKLLWNSKSCFLLIDSRFINDNKYLSYKYKLKTPKMYRDNTEEKINPKLIDNLYSELVVLDYFLW